MAPTNDRESRGQVIANIERAVKRYSDYRYVVNSQSNKIKYKVILTKIEWTCSCPDHKFRGVKCKHIFAVEFSRAVRVTVK